MEPCPKCKKMTAERNHYTGLLICYNRACPYKEERKEMARKLTYIELYGGLRGVVNEIEKQTPETIRPGQGVDPSDPIVQELESILKECKEGVGDVSTG